MSSITCHVFKRRHGLTICLLLSLIVTAPVCAGAENNRGDLQQRLERLSRELEALKQEARNKQSAGNAKEDLQRYYRRNASLIVTPEKQGEIDCTLSYIQSSSTQIAIDGFSILPVFVVGEIVSERERREDIIGGMSFSYGLPHRYQFNLYMPYRSQVMRTVDTNQKEETFRDKGAGDAEIGISKQLVDLPWQSSFDYLASLTWKTTTGLSDPNLNPNRKLTQGTGFEGARLGLTAIKSLPPAALILNGSYTYNFRKLVDIEGSGTTINPGNSINLGVSMSLALNRSLSINYGLEHQYTGYTTSNGIRNPGSSLAFGNFVVGCSYRLDSGNWLNINLIMGLSREAPDYQFSVKVPVIRF